MYARFTIQFQLQLQLLLFYLRFLKFEPRFQTPNPAFTSLQFPTSNSQNPRDPVRPSVRDAFNKTPHPSFPTYLPPFPKPLIFLLLLSKKNNIISYRIISSFPFLPILNLNLLCMARQGIAWQGAPKPRGIYFETESVARCLLC